MSTDLFLLLQNLSPQYFILWVF
uniref:Uncharacterized protein n=1 Tax=Anguilla anguilla TaxID=7936 RepID=A0A0E9V7S6_ANGAN